MKYKSKLVLGNSFIYLDTQNNPFMIYPYSVLSIHICILLLSKQHFSISIETNIWWCILCKPNFELKILDAVIYYSNIANLIYI